jgi:hypothetical protein
MSVELIINEKENNNMNKEELIKEIENQIDENIDSNYCGGVLICREDLQKSNQLLTKIRRYLKSEDEYKRGANDAWELAVNAFQKSVSAGGHSGDKNEEIFGIRSLYYIARNFTGAEALDKFKEYEKKKKEEEEKIVVGDIVKHSDVMGCGCKTFIVTQISDTHISGIYRDNGDSCRFIYPNSLITKTGKHVDISGLLKDAEE